MILTIFSIMIKYGTDISSTTLALLNLMMELIIASMLILSFKPTMSGIKFLASDARKKVNKKEIISIIVFKGLITIGGEKLLLDILYILDENFVNEFISDIIVKINGTVDYVISSIVLCILCPTIEELIFRNIIFKRIAKRSANAYLGILISSIIFAAMNIGNGIIGALIFGVTNCIIYIKYKNIFVPILINLSYNILTSILLIPAVSENTSYLFITTNNLLESLCSGGLMLLIGVILFIKFFIKNKNYAYDYNEELKNNLEIYEI